MAIDPNRWTIKSQEAFAAAAELARKENNAEITPDHLLAALVAQPEGLAVPLLGRAGVEPTALAEAPKVMKTMEKPSTNANAELSRPPRGAWPSFSCSTPIPESMET